MRALLILLFVWSRGHCLPTPAPADTQRQDAVDTAASVQVDNFVHLFPEEATAVPETNQWEDLLKFEDAILVRNAHVTKSAVNVDTTNRKVIVKVPCRRTSNNPCLGSEIYEFVLLKAEELVT